MPRSTSFPPQFERRLQSCEKAALKEAAVRGLEAANFKVLAMRNARKDLEKALTDLCASFGALRQSLSSEPCSNSLTPGAFAPDEASERRMTCLNLHLSKGGRHDPLSNPGMFSWTAHAMEQSCQECSSTRRHFNCVICLRICWSDPKDALALPCCGIEYCGQCWGGMATAALSTPTPTALRHLRCPTPHCQLPTQAHQLARRAAALHDGLERISKNVASDDARRDIGNLRRLHSVKRSALCPSCRSVNVAPKASNDMRCTECDSRFCLIHGDGHPSTTCTEWVSKVPMEKEQRDFARKMHTRRCPACLRSIVKNGGCDNMVCACGNAFRWSAATVEVPCTCLNVHNSKGPIMWWGNTCPGAAPVAHAKLAAWRLGLVTVASPCVVLAAPIVAIRYGLPALAQCASGPNGILGIWKQACVERVNEARLRRRGIMPGSFEYNFHVHGCGRRTLFP